MSDWTKVPNYSDLINPTLSALHILGGSGKNDELCEEVIKLLDLPDSIIDIPHGNSSQSELAYRMAWARTYLKKYGIIDNSARAVWTIKPEHADTKSLDVDDVVRTVKSQERSTEKEKSSQVNLEELPAIQNDEELPDEIKKLCS